MKTGINVTRKMLKPVCITFTFIILTISAMIHSVLVAMIVTITIMVSARGQKPANISASSKPAKI